MSNNPNIDVVVVNYNSKDLVVDCVNNLLLSPSINEIVVVDNGSTDGSKEAIKEKFNARVKLIETGNNGLSAGYNLGYKNTTSDYVLYLGTDAFPSPNALEKILKYMESNPEVGVATAKLVLRDGTLDMDAHRGFATPWSSLMHWFFLDTIFPKSKLFNGYFLGYKNFSETHEVDVCISHFMFVRRSAQEQIGPWDEDYFLYGEDVDFCYRIKEKGYKIMYLSPIEVLHYKGVTVDRKSSRDIKTAAKLNKANLRKVKKESTRAMGLFYRKHLSKKYPAILNIIVYLGIFLLERLRLFLIQLK